MLSTYLWLPALEPGHLTGLQGCWWPGTVLLLTFPVPPYSGPNVPWGPTFPQFSRMNSVYPFLEKWGSQLFLCKSWVQ